MNKKIKKAIKDSIEHWNTDIIARFKAGDTILRDQYGHLIWTDGTSVKCYSANCPLCVVTDATCKKCPLQFCGTHSPWNNFHCDPTLQNAKNMIKHIKRQGKIYEQSTK
jgi:hypothetical protein